MTEFAVHFGVVPSQPFGAAEVAGHNDPTTEVAITTGGYGAGYISGSWACWGPDDQETDGDESLHVLIYVSDPFRPEYLLGLREALARQLHTESRLIDHAVITDADDWSVVQAVVTYGSHPEVVVYRTRAGLA